MIGLDAENLEFGEVTGAIKKYFQLQKMRDQAQWEKTRFISWASMVIHAKKGSLNGPKDLIKFPWEEAKRKKLTQKEIDNLLEKFEQPRKVVGPIKLSDL